MNHLSFLFPGIAVAVSLWGGLLLLGLIFCPDDDRQPVDKAGPRASVTLRTKSRRHARPYSEAVDRSIVPSRARFARTACNGLRAPSAEANSSRP